MCGRFINTFKDTIQESFAKIRDNLSVGTEEQKKIDVNQENQLIELNKLNQSLLK